MFVVGELDFFLVGGMDVWVLLYDVFGGCVLVVGV